MEKKLINVSKIGDVISAHFQAKNSNRTKFENYSSLSREFSDLFKEYMYSDESTMKKETKCTVFEDKSSSLCVQCIGNYQYSALQFKKLREYVVGLSESLTRSGQGIQLRVDFFEIMPDKPTIKFVFTKDKI